MNTAHEAIAAIRAEVKRRIEYNSRPGIGDDELPPYAPQCNDELQSLISFLDTLEAEEKDVDLEKEIQGHIKECLDVKFPTTDIELIKKDVAYTARKFYNLGLNSKK